MAIPFLDLKLQYEEIRNAVEPAVLELLASGSYILGQQVQSFEQKLAGYCGAEYAVGVASGTDALILILDALGVGPGDEVITTPFTFFATAEAISRVGATPVFVDIDPGSFNIDPEAVSGAITERTKAIMPVHLYGQPAEMDSLNAVAADAGLFVVEDACQAIGSEYNGRRAGSLGAAAAFSFYPTKNLGGVGDGGAVVTSDPEIASRIRLLRDHASPKRYYHTSLGYNSRLDAIQAAVLSIKLDHLDRWNAARRRVAERYRSLLGSLSLVLPEESRDVSHVYHLFTCRSRERDRVVASLAEDGIASGVYYPLPLHLQEAYRELGYGEGSLPAAEKASKEVFSLPIYPELTDSAVDAVAESIRRALS